MTGSACRCIRSGWSEVDSCGLRQLTGQWRSPPPSSPTCSKAYRNIPSGEADESPVEEIRVLDPRHPLYGRSFRVLRRLIQRGGNFPRSYEVEYCNGSTLLIPVSAIEYDHSENNQTKLSIEALHDLLSVIDCF